MEKPNGVGGGEGVGGGSRGSPGENRPFFERPPLLSGGVNPEVARLVSGVTVGREPPYLHRENAFAVAAAELEENLAFAARGVGEHARRMIELVDDRLWRHFSYRDEGDRLVLFAPTPQHETLVHRYVELADLLASLGMHREVVSNTQARYTGYRHNDLAHTLLNYAHNALSMPRDRYRTWRSRLGEEAHYEVFLEEGHEEVRLVLESSDPDADFWFKVGAEQGNGGHKQSHRERMIEELEKRGLWPPGIR